MKVINLNNQKCGSEVHNKKVNKFHIKNKQLINHTEP